MSVNPVTLFLCGDVMLGRGVDQLLPHPGDPTLRESYVLDARDYVDLAENLNGPIPLPVDFSWPWGDALETLTAAEPDVRIVNLETSITRRGEFAPGKAVHYRMNPANLPCLLAARPDACVLANNHVLDFGRTGLTDTLDALTHAGLRAVGAGRDADQAWQPAIIPLSGGGRVLVISAGTPSSGIPTDWVATKERAGVAYAGDLSDAAAAAIADRIRRVKRTGDLTVVSLHWGSNWGYAIPREQTRFAHALVDAGMDVVHGHSCHHPRPIEIHRGKLILYGCGDLIDDYEGIPGYEEFRGDLRLLYFVSLDRSTGTLTSLRMTPLRAHRMRLRHASSHDAQWLRATLDRTSGGFGAHIDLRPDNTLTLGLP